MTHVWLRELRDQFAVPLSRCREDVSSAKDPETARAGLLAYSRSGRMTGTWSRPTKNKRMLKLQLSKM
eukprot:scaffold4097_cov166-Amphora_coffeaeformis.AAC.21